MTETVATQIFDARGKPRVQTINTDPSKTVQSDAHLADIENIMKSFLTGGQEMLDDAEMMFMDVTEFTDLADALQQARLAEVEFMRLPSKVREVFDHDVAVWLDSAHDEDKRDELVEKGFLKAREVVSPKEPEKAPEKAPEPGAEGPPEKGTE